MKNQAKKIERKNAVLKLRLRHEEKEKFAETADIAGMTLSEFIRKSATGIQVVAETDLVMLRELRRIGGLLKHVHVSSGGAYSQQTAAALQELRAYFRMLAHDYQKN